MPFQKALLSLHVPDEETEAWGGDLTLPKVPQPAGNRTEISNKCPESELAVRQAGRAPRVSVAATLRPHSRDEESRGWLSINFKGSCLQGRLTSGLKGHSHDPAEPSFLS